MSVNIMVVSRRCSSLPPGLIALCHHRSWTETLHDLDRRRADLFWSPATSCQGAGRRSGRATNLPPASVGIPNALPRPPTRASCPPPRATIAPPAAEVKRLREGEAAWRGSEAERLRQPYPL